MNYQFVNKVCIEEWADHSEAKKRIKSWFSSTCKFSIFTVDSAQHLRDLSIWIKNNIENVTVGEATFQSNIPVYKWQLIHDLALSLQKEVSFENFDSKLRQIDNLKNENIFNQDFTNEAKIGLSKSESVTQNMTIISPSSYISLDTKRDMHIEWLYEAFLEDLKIKSKSDVLLLIKFGHQGLSCLNSDFRKWFIGRFCHNTLRYPNIKICVINEGDLEEFYIDNYQEKFGNLTKETFFKEAEKYIEDSKLRHIICNLVISFDDHNEVPYGHFKRAIISLQKSFNELESQYGPKTR